MRLVNTGLLHLIAHGPGPLVFKDSLQGGDGVTDPEPRPGPNAFHAVVCDRLLRIAQGGTDGGKAVCSHLRLIGLESRQKRRPPMMNVAQ